MRVALASACIAGLVVAGCGGHGATSTSDSSSPERTAALKAAHQVQATVRGTFLVATYRPNAGIRAPSNTGHACWGPTVRVRLVWDGADFTHGSATTNRAPDRRQALVITADGSTGVPCVVGADYGAATSDPGPGEIYLYGPRKDLVPAR